MTPELGEEREDKYLNDIHVPGEEDGSTTDTLIQFSMSVHDKAMALDHK
jgi:hypothetical protein